MAKLLRRLCHELNSYWVLFAAIAVCLPAFVTLQLWLSGNRYSPELFSDWDEFYYLPQIFDLRWSNFRLPHEVTDILLKKFLKIVQLSPATLSFIFDCICPLFALLAMTEFFSYFHKKREIGAVTVLAAAVSILSPWIWSYPVFAIDQVFSFSSRLGTVSHTLYPSVPCYRSFYTQISWIPFSVCFLLLARALFSKTLSAKSAIVLALLTGLSIYLYFFAWLTIVFVGLLALGFEFVFFKGHWLTTYKRRFLFVAFGASLISLPGLWWLLPGGQLFQPGPPGSSIQALSGISFRDVWFLSPTSLVLLIFLLKKFSSKTRHSYAPHQRLLFVFIGSLLVAELFVMNLQAVANRWLTPYHVPLFFLHPILSGILVVILLQHFDRRLTAAITTALLLTLGGFRTAAVYYNRNNIGLGTHQFLRFVDNQLPPDAVVVTYPYELEPLRQFPTYLLSPYWLKTLTSRQSYSQFMSFDSDRSKYVQKEFAISKLLCGKAQLLMPCPVVPLNLTNNDLLVGAGTFQLMQRTVDCSIAENFKLPDEYAIAEPGLLFVALSKDQYSYAPVVLATPWIWESSDGEWRVWKM